jgi:hypothetical protein
MNKLLKYALVITFLCESCHVCKNFLNNEINPMRLSSLVLKKDTISPCFGNISLQDGTVLTMCYCGYNDIWNNIEQGDSLYKKSGTTIILLYKKNILYKKYEYPCCDY